MTSKWRNGRRVAVLTAMGALIALVLAGVAAASVTLSADSQSLVVGQTVTLTANVLDANGSPAPDQTVTFTVLSGPNAGLTDDVVTDVDGNAFFSYSSSQTGTDDVQAAWSTGEEVSNDVTVTWSASQAAFTLSVDSSSHVVGQTATVSAKVIGANGSPAPEETIRFTVTSGPNAGLTGQGVSDANGVASFSYSSSTTGTDDVTAEWIRREQSSNPVSVTWSAPEPPPPPKTDVGIGLSAPSLVRVGDTGTWTATVTNGGPDVSTGVVVSASAPASATLVSASESAGDGCSGSTCRVGTLAKGATVTVQLVYRLTQAGSVTVSASVTGDYDTNSSNNAASATATVLADDTPPPPPPPPTQPGTFNAIPTDTILINGTTVPSDQPLVLKDGDTVDATNGILTFTTADGSTGSFSSTQPTASRRTASARRAAAELPAQFTLSQGSDGVTTLTLAGGDFGSCGSSRSLAANKKPVRGLWGTAKGNFRTSARFSSATVRGTIWFVQDRCDGSLTQVVQGTVAVRDTVRNRTVLVSGGSSYLAKSPLKLVAQTAAIVAKRGLRYDGKLFKTKKAFERYLDASGYTWAEFVRRYPALAKALAARV
jgi:uncharacterized repeat protein (TIGR01451 family)